VTIDNPIADTGSMSIKNSSVWAELFARDKCEPRSNNGREKFYRFVVIAGLREGGRLP
jgi:hypothetical protein